MKRSVPSKVLTLCGLAICQHDENWGMVADSWDTFLSFVQDLNSLEQTAIHVCGCRGEKETHVCLHCERSEAAPRWPEMPAFTPGQGEAPNEVLSRLHVGGGCLHQGAPPRLYFRPKEDQVEVVPWPHVLQDFKECLLGL